MKRKTKFSEYDPDKASGPPCQHCGAECVEKALNKRGGCVVWVCGDSPSAHGKIPYLMGLDIIERLREERKNIEKAKGDALRRDFAMDDADALGDILADL